MKADSMNDNVLVSAIIPSYNRGYVVGNAIDSILNQTYRNTEVVVVDDGSTDNTQERLKEYGDRIRVVYQKNSGPSAARNHGIRASRGEIIAFLDSDDLWLPTKLERQVSLLQQSAANVVCCLGNAIQKLPNGTEHNMFDRAQLKHPCDEGIWFNVTDVVATRCVMLCQMVAIRRKALERVGYFDESMRFLEDYDLSLRLSIEGPWGFIREPLAIINSTSADSLSLKISKEEVGHERYILKTRERVFATLRNRNPPATNVGYLKQAIKKSRRDLWAAQLRSSDVWGARIVGNLMKWLEHYRMAIFRRSPWFPKVRAVPIESAKRPPTGASSLLGVAGTHRDS
jgi:glycosyltransferase involved in cell wall biosynthesis